MHKNVEKFFIVHGEDTMYRVRNNPDCDGKNGEYGIYIEWKDYDSPEDAWEDSFFIGPSHIDPLIEVLKEFSQKA